LDLIHFPGVKSSTTTFNKRILRRLLKVGRWNNESEIVRYGLSLVVKEVQNDALRSLAPVKPGMLADVYQQMTPEEVREDEAMSKASSRIKPKPGEL